MSLPENPAPHAAPDQSSAPASQDFSVILVGDTGFSGHMEAPVPGGTIHQGHHHGYDALFAGIAGELKADFIFANVETVVSARADLPPNPNSFNFRSHPEGVDALIGHGFNLFSLANNHALDFGIEGAVETRATFEAAAEGHPIAFSGVGETRDRLLRPRILQRNATSLALTAIGFLSLGHERLRAGDDVPGQLSLRSRDFDDVVKALSEARTDLKLLSIHYGEELVNVVARDDIRRYRPLLRSIPGTHLVVGHHPHVARAIEVENDNVIFYSLGNFLHLGTSDMSDQGECRDFSLLARLHYRKSPAGKVVLRAIEVVPIHSTQIRPKRMPAAQAAVRIAALNSMSDHLDRSDGTRYGVTLAALPDGSGLYCRHGVAKGADRIARLCRAFDHQASVVPPGRPETSLPCGM
jgi:poly-gamma-glutamate capsule biosynthesis protein CapA/YwtB (metallophosphatase superfamily)